VVRLCHYVDIYCNYFIDEPMSFLSFHGFIIPNKPGRLWSPLSNQLYGHWTATLASMTYLALFRPPIAPESDENIERKVILTWDDVGGQSSSANWKKMGTGTYQKFMLIRQPFSEWIKKHLDTQENTERQNRFCGLVVNGGQNRFQWPSKRGNWAVAMVWW